VAPSGSFARRNQARISLLLLLATVNYVLAAIIAAVVATVGFVLLAIFNLDVLPSDATEAKYIGIGILVLIVLAVPVGALLALVRIPRQRRVLEERVLAETGARVDESDEHVRVRNLLEGLAIAADLPAPRFAVIDDPAPNSFGVGTRPGNTIIGVTTGLIDKLARDELEAILAYEVSRIEGWDIALSSWTVALTAGAISTLEADDAKKLFGFFSIRAAERLQVWALRDQGQLRDRHAIHFTRNPRALVRALEQLHADQSVVKRVSRATAPLWVEFPTSLANRMSGRSGARLASELLLDARIDALRKEAGVAPSGGEPDRQALG
jgi:heat shock protein HtpX